jgi:glycosyltransferase involved in cell wall biosynthesis
MKATRKNRKLKSVWGTTPIISICNNSKAESLLGIKADTLVFSSYFITDRFRYDFSQFDRNRFTRALIRILVFPWALLKYDIFHFFCDRGILPTKGWSGVNLFELILMRLFRKKVFVYTYGADVRTREKTMQLGKYNCCMHCPNVGIACVCDEARHEKNVEKISRYATEVLSMGDMMEYLPESDAALFFWPIDVKKVNYIQESSRHDGPIRIVHAPNHRHYKGTDYLIEAVEELKKEGLSLELVLVEKKANEEAMKLYQEADIIAEQFLIGWHGFMAIEAMALGKPVICYIRKQGYLLAPEECPIVNANPDNLKEVIQDLAENPDKRKNVGKQGRAYVEKYFSLESFSARLAGLYRRHGILD